MATPTSERKNERTNTTEPKQVVTRAPSTMSLAVRLMAVLKCQCKVQVDARAPRRNGVEGVEERQGLRIHGFLFLPRLAKTNRSCRATMTGYLTLSREPFRGATCNLRQVVLAEDANEKCRPRVKRCRQQRRPNPFWMKIFLSNETPHNFQQVPDAADAYRPSEIFAYHRNESSQHCAALSCGHEARNTSCDTCSCVCH